jgi:2-polyprenyl-3-methyl-5-hydroxy-6-metoxy-1,4-benzoquinol methylase
VNISPEEEPAGSFGGARAGGGGKASLVLCPVCGASAIDKRFYAERDWEVRRCGSCSYAWVVDLANPAATTAFSWSEDIVRESQLRMHMYVDRLDRIERFRSGPKTWLDVGCGGGGMLKCVADAGYQAEGIELSPSAETITAWFGIPVHRVPLTEAAGQLRQDRYGVISYFHVLEHILDPRRELQTARRLLHPEGLLVVEVPCFDSVPWKLLRSRHRHFYRGHRSYFNPISLRRLLENTGFSVTLSQTVPYQMTLDWLLRRVGSVTNPMRAVLPSGWGNAVLSINTGEYLLMVARSA